VRWEGYVVRQELYGARTRNTKYIPVLWSPSGTEQVPQILRGAQRYDLGTSEAYESLYRHLTGQPKTPAPPLGSLVPMPPRERQTRFSSTLEPRAGAAYTSRLDAKLRSEPTLVEPRAGAAHTSRLDAKLRSQLEHARQTLGLSQGVLAELAGISQGNASNCLQGKPVRIDSLRRLLSAFASQVASASDKGLSGEQIQELRKAVDAARKAVDGSVETSTHFARPGSPMPENAVNRVRRQEDRQLLAALDDAPFTAAIVGPPECGKTTTLQLLLEEARRKGFAVVDFDATLIPEPVESMSMEGGPSERFLPELAEEVGRVIGEKPPNHLRTSLDLVRFLRDVRSRRPAPPLLIAVDHAEINLTIETLAQACRALDAHKGRTQMSWVLVANYLTDGFKLGPLSRLAPSPMLEMSWFSPEQLKELVGLYEMQDDDLLDFLWDSFLGQPSLTHVAMDRFRSLAELSLPTLTGLSQALRGEIRLGAGDFGRHLRRRLDFLRRSYFWKEFYLSPPNVASFLADCENDSTKRVLAERFGLLRPEKLAGKKPRMPTFYQEHFAALYDAT